tara:strand:- start:9234 stop:11030 length:1797 start_codon:yes stop_codon:yes gene_type:complete
MAEKKPAINYTSRDFTTIKSDLVDYARRYYPETFRDFSVNSFGSLMLDTVSYVGDILSFYLDYQVNETFLSTASEYDNILKISRQLGLKPDLSPASFGVLTLFVLIPAGTNGAPNYDYAPTLKAGSKFSTTDGKLYTLLEDVNFKDIEQNEIVPGQINNQTSVPISYVIRARGQAVSGELLTRTIEVGAYERFRKVELPGTNITEVVSVVDTEGNPYFEVDYLTQNIIYVPIQNTGPDRATVANILKPIAVPRRYTVTKERGSLFLQFGFGTNEDSEEVLDPSKVLVNQHGKKYISDDSFDPAALVKSDSLGISPSNTTLTIIYRVNTTENTNTSANSIINVRDSIMSFQNELELDITLLQNTKDSLEVINETAFVGSAPLPSSDELKQRAFGVYSMQNRIVTQEDLVTAAYNMPSSFGSISKASAQQDSDSFNQRNINLYVMARGADGKLQKANQTIKNNLKSHISRYKMINDSIDILDANIINLSLFYTIVAYPDVDKFRAIDTSKRDLSVFFARRRDYEIGESFSITDIFSVLKNSALVLDVVEVSVLTKTGPLHADTGFIAENNLSADGRFITCPSDSIFEIKFPNNDIIGTIK